MTGAGCPSLPVNSGRNTQRAPSDSVNKPLPSSRATVSAKLLL